MKTETISREPAPTGSNLLRVAAVVCYGLNLVLAYVLFALALL